MDLPSLSAPPVKGISWLFGVATGEEEGCPMSGRAARRGAKGGGHLRQQTDVSDQSQRNESACHDMYMHNYKKTMFSQTVALLSHGGTYVVCMHPAYNPLMHICIPIVLLTIEAHP